MLSRCPVDARRGSRQDGARGGAEEDLTDWDVVRDAGLGAALGML